MARPTKDIAERRTERLNLRLTLAEMAHVQAQAGHAGVCPHEYMRRRVLGHRVSAVRSAADMRVVSEVNRIGVNLNQLVRSTHASGTVHADATELLAQIGVLLDRLTGGGHGP